MLLEGEAGHQDAISRTEYSVKTLMKNDVILEKLSYQLADWNRGQAENRMNRLISQYGKKIELVMSNNDEMALGAVEAYRKAGYVREEWPVIDQIVPEPQDCPLPDGTGEQNQLPGDIRTHFYRNSRASADPFFCSGPCSV